MRTWQKINLSLIVRAIIFLVAVIFFLLNRKMPLIGTAGFEAANLFIIILGPIFCLASALHKTEKNTPNFRLVFLKELFWASVIVGCYSLLLLYNGLFIHSCSPGAGLTPFFITLLPPLLLNVSVGALIATIFRPLWLRIIIFVTGYLFYYAWIFLAWWQETSFRVLTHASLMISSDLLAGSALNLGMVGFRTATLLIATALIIFGFTFQTHSRTSFFNSSSNHPIKNSFLILFLLLSATVTHWQSLKNIGKNHASLESDYSLSVSHNSIIVRTNPELVSEQQAREILNEALLYQNRIRKFLPPKLSKPITIWLYPNDQAKFTYTGAAHVHFALPKHRELHISLASIPHPVLGHELAHIYIGEYSQTLLGLPGRLGIIPNMALTEGLAMYLTPELAIENDLSMFEQAQALHQAGLGINIEELFSLDPTRFALSHPHSSYIFAGAFLAFVLEHSAHKERASERLKVLIAQGTIDYLFASDKEKTQTITAFRKELEKPIEAYALLWAKHNFDRSSILGNNCQDPYHKQKSAFKRNILNDNYTSALTSISSLPQRAQIALIKKAQTSLLNQGRYQMTLALIKNLEERYSPHAAEFNELWLDQCSALIYQDDFSKASQVLQNIDPEYLNQASKRQIAIGKQLLFNPIQSPLSIAILQTTFAKNNKLLSLVSRLGMNLGKNIRIKNSELSIGQYLYARILMRDKDYQRALAIIEELYKNQALLPKELLQELQLMLAQSNFHLKNYSQAKNIYLALLNHAQKTAVTIVLNDMLARIEFLQNSPL
ncbi:MAG: hypothetical protein H6731_09560 [Myxococcales bacterium]|nr:MAG: hypothetical protein H6731_09560 [Myxococcales bacterium]